jgi:hypothetical protein
MCAPVLGRVLLASAAAGLCCLVEQSRGRFVAGRGGAEQHAGPLATDAKVRRVAQVRLIETGCAVTAMPCVLLLGVCCCYWQLQLLFVCAGWAAAGRFVAGAEQHAGPLATDAKVWRVA